MGARPLFALNLVAFPRNLLGENILEEILRGGSTIAAEAGIAVVGGHSIDDAEPKYGLAVIGEVDPNRIVRNVGARPGDALILTKPIGTGIIATALKKDAASNEAIAAAIASMTTLNRAAAEAMVQAGVNAATDVTGFGLLGHLHEMLRGSGVAARLRASAVPFLAETPSLLQAGHVPGGTKRNFEDAHRFTKWQPGIPDWLPMLLADAQTSGGLLIACPRTKSEALLHALVRARTPAAAIVGEIVAGDSSIEIVM